MLRLQMMHTVVSLGCGQHGPPEFDTKRCKSLIRIDHDRKLPLQQAQLGIWIGILDVQGVQHRGLVAVDGGDAANRHALIDAE